MSEKVNDTIVVESGPLHRLLLIMLWQELYIAEDFIRIALIFLIVYSPGEFLHVFFMRQVIDLIYDELSISLRIFGFCWF